MKIRPHFFRQCIRGVLQSLSKLFVCVFLPIFGVNFVFVLESDGCGRPPRRSPPWYNGQEGERPAEEEEGRLQADAGAHHDGLGTRDADRSTIERHAHIGFPWRKIIRK